MYKIKNITKGKLLLFDIGVNLNAGASVDLDAIMPREKADASVNLKVAEDNELIAVLHKDVVKAVNQSISFDPSLFLEMERRIREQIVQQMQTVHAPTVVAAPVHTQNTEVADLTAQLTALISKMGNQPQTNSPSNAVQDAFDYTPDDDKLREVHAKALKRMTKGSSGHVEAKETNTQSEIGNRADELDDLLK